MKLARTSVVLLASAAALILAGCARDSAPAVEPPPLHPDIAKNLGVVGIAPIEAPAAVAGRKVGKLAAAGHGASAAGRSYVKFVADNSSDGLDCFLNHSRCLDGMAFVFTPFVMIGGAVYGVVAGESGAEVEEGRTLLLQVLAEKRIGEALRKHLATEFSIQTGHPVYLLDDPSAQDRASTDVETIVRIEHIFVVFEPLEKTTLPLLRAKLSVRLRLLRAGSNEELHVADMEAIIGTGLHNSTLNTFREWIADDAVLFRDALDATPLDDLVRFTVIAIFPWDNTRAPEGEYTGYN